MPEQPPAQPAAPPGPSLTEETGPAAPRRETGPVPTLAVFSRPLTISDVLDGAFQIIKARPRTMIGIAAWFVLPVGLLIATVDVGVLGGDLITTLTDPATFEEGSAANSNGGFGFTIVSGLVSSGLVTLIAAPMAQVVDSWRQGHELGVRQAFKALGKSWVTVVVAFVLVHLIEAIGTLLLLLPGLVAMVFMLVVAPVVAVERVSARAAVGRSYELVKHRFWSVLWIALLSGLVAGILSLLLPLLPLALTALFGFGGEQYVVAVGTIAASLLTLPFVAACAVLVYFDLRVRAEGLDIEAALGEHFGDAS